MMTKVFTVPEGVILEDLLSGFPHACAVLDERCKLVCMNPEFERLTGFPRDLAEGVFAEFIIRSNINNPLGQVYHRVLETGEAVLVDGDILNRYRQKKPIRFSISLIHTSRKRKTKGLLVVMQDISALESASKSRMLKSWTADIIGHSAKMQEVFEIMPLIAHTDASVLITGETGTGKDRFAEAIHCNSERSQYPFIKLNCGTLPPNLLESELFGHVKGAFTGAVRDKQGMFKLAHKGTLFLTEIGDMPLPLQVKLLSVLDDSSFYPVGGEQKVSVDVRIIAATNRSLRDQVRRGKFREDLYYRLNVLHIHLPPLREREGDIRFLLDHYLVQCCQKLGKETKAFSDTALRDLQLYSYPGNIRELRNIVEYCANVCREQTITRESLPPYLLGMPGLNDLRTENRSPGEATHIAHQHSPVRGVEEAKTQESWPEAEREMILNALKECRGSRTKAAAMLGWGRSTLWRKITQHGLL